MSLAQTVIFEEDKPPVAGWVWAAILVVAAHLILAYFIIHARDDMQNGAESPPVVMIELAPLPVAPPAAQETEAPPAPVKTEEAHPEDMQPPTPDITPTVVPPAEPPPMVEPPPQAVAVPAEPPPMVEPPPQAVAVPEAPLAPKPEVVLPKEVPKPVPPKPAPKVEKKIEKVTKPERKPPAERTAAPKRVEAAPAPRAAAPAARPAGNPSVSSAEWGGMVRARIMAAKSCPGGASGASGAATVSFSISGGGALVGARVTGSSGNAALDAQAASMVRSAGPYPPTPTGGTVSLSIPIRFGC